MHLALHPVSQRRIVHGLHHPVQGGNRRLEFKYRLTMENYTPQPLPVRICDRLPYSGDSTEIRVTLAELKTPAETMVLGDASNMDICWQTYRMAFAGVCGWEPPGGCTNTAAWGSPNNTVHNGGENLAFADGHSKWMNGSAILAAAGAGPSNVGGDCSLPFWGGM